MKYNFVLAFNIEKPDKLYEIIRCEAGKQDRSELNIKKKKNMISFNISADDSVALRSSMNLVLKILTIYEKTENMVKNG